MIRLFHNKTKTGPATSRLVRDRGDVKPATPFALPRMCVCGVIVLAFVAAVIVARAP